MGLRNFLFEQSNNDVEMNNEDVLVNEDFNYEVSIENVNTDTLLEDIYRENNLTNDRRSIFKVEEVIKALPVGMPLDQKREAVLNTLPIFDLKLEDIIDNADERIKVLNATKQTLNDSHEKLIKESEDEIEELQKMIETIKQKIYETKTEDEISSNTICIEIKRVGDLKLFLLNK